MGYTYHVPTSTKVHMSIMILIFSVNNTEAIIDTVPLTKNPILILFALPDQSKQSAKKVFATPKNSVHPRILIADTGESKLDCTNMLRPDRFPLLSPAHTVVHCI